MAYFLKKTKNKKGLYLQIYESFYDPGRKQTAHKSFKPLGYVEELIKEGIDDPISYYSDEVKRMNLRRKSERTEEKPKQITAEIPVCYPGYFPLKRVNAALGVKPDIDLLQSKTGFQFNVYSEMSGLVYANAVKPRSQRKILDVLPCLYETVDYSLHQLCDGIAFLGTAYQRIIEIYNQHIAAKCGRNTKITYFCYTNFCFAVDAENGPYLKETGQKNRLESTVGVGLLLDADGIPLGMQICPGNKSGKFVMREAADNLKMCTSVNGRTIFTADEGLICPENIYSAIAGGDGYLFSRSIKQLSSTEKDWVLLDQDYQDVKDKDGHLQYRYKSFVDDFVYKLNDENGRCIVTFRAREKHIVTFSPSLAQKKIDEIDREAENARSMCASRANRGEFGSCGKYVFFTSVAESGNKTDGKAQTAVNERKIAQDRKLAGYSLLITSEVDMPVEEICETYRNLQEIEEPFRVMKSDLDACPFFLHKPESITGHFLICYLTVLFLRLLQFHTWNNEYRSEDIMDFVRGFQVIRAERCWINISRSTPFLRALADQWNLPVTNYYLRDSDIEEMFLYPFSFHARFSDQR